MDQSDANSASVSIQKVASAQFRRPSLHLLVESQARKKYLSLCVPLHKAALQGDCKAVRHIIEQDSALLNAAITKGWATVLHVAAGANHVHLVEELVKMMDRSDLELQDYKGNTAFCFAAAVGNMRIAQIMLNENKLLPTIRGGEGVTPVLIAALQGQSEMALDLYPKSVEILEEWDRTLLFFTCISTGIYELALKLVNQYPELAFERDDNNETGLHILARKPSCSDFQSPLYRKQIMKSCKGVKQDMCLQLVRRLWKEILLLNDSKMMEVIREPSQVIFYAAEVGNFEFLVELINTYPDLMWEVDGRNRSMIHIAVLHRHACIFNLIHEMGPMRDFVVSSVDDVDQNNLLHFAAKLAPQDRLNMVSGAAFQMMLELLWFEEVKKVMHLSFIEMKNSEGITPRQLFTIEHEELLKKAESWMKRTANSCMVVSTLITTGVFSAAFSLPGGNNDNTGTPNYLEKSSFLIFAVSDAIALISSSTSILIFLSILISRYAEEDFLKSLPLKLIFGLVALFFSIISMMVAFSSAFFITYYHGIKWVPSFISVLAFVPIPLFVFLQFPLWSDILYTTYFCKSLFRPNKYIVY
ncbi:ankyrin repeat-containing protein NPR4-like [Senna tora]|uniref:Ankyrin repeat-containing protein NPR4-like n=1 Tax=Senna tora TaxID=362788 RepID=A0A835CIY3_9FABA|nr:ankyrin repeat-containing protein NPR4-like [Senna tora]